MEIISAWLLFYKASYREDSLENQDGSDFFYGIASVSACGLSEAIDKFHSYLNSKNMDLVELNRAERFKQINFSEATETNKIILESAAHTLESGMINIYGISSEAKEADEEDGVYYDWIW
jgi:hypothetical protein